MANNIEIDGAGKKVELFLMKLFNLIKRPGYTLAFTCEKTDFRSIHWFTNLSVKNSTNVLKATILEIEGKKNQFITDDSKRKSLYDLKDQIDHLNDVYDTHITLSIFKKSKDKICLSVNNNFIEIETHGMGYMCLFNQSKVFTKSSDFVYALIEGLIEGNGK